MNKSIAIYIDSKDPSVETFPNVARAKFIFNDPIVCQEDEALLVSLIHARVPYSFYNIRTSVNDVFAFHVELKANEIYTITMYLSYRIPPGNYTISSLSNIIKLNIVAIIKKYVTRSNLGQLPSSLYDNTFTNGMCENT